MNSKETKKGKFQLAVEIVGSMPDADRSAIVQAIQEKLDTNKKNASTYYGRYLKEVLPQNHQDQPVVDEPIATASD